MYKIVLFVFSSLLPGVLLCDTDISKPMRFSTFYPCSGNASVCALTILAEGTIESDTDKLFTAYFSKHNANRVCFNSPGGSLAGGIKLGKTIRKLGLDTCVSPEYSKQLEGTLNEKVFRKDVICASSCVFALSGGLNRLIEKNSNIGIHQFAGREKPIDEGDTQVAVVGISSYLEKMGVSRNLLDTASLVPHDEIYWLSDEEIKLLRLDNMTPIESGWKLDSLGDGDLFIHLNQQIPGNLNTINLFINKDGNSYVLSLFLSLHQSSPSKIQSALKALNGNDLRLFIDDQQSYYTTEWETIDGDIIGTNVRLRTKDVNLLRTGTKLFIASGASNADSIYRPDAVVSLGGLAKYLKTLDNTSK